MFHKFSIFLTPQVQHTLRPSELDTSGTFDLGLVLDPSFVLPVVTAVATHLEYDAQKVGPVLLLCRLVSLISHNMLMCFLFAFSLSPSSSAYPPGTLLLVLLNQRFLLLLEEILS